MVAFDYLIVGHVTRDLVEGTFAIGGTVSYAARTARALGCRVGVVTSAGPDLDLGHILDGIEVFCLPAAATTTFENVYTEAGRRQVLHSVAEPLTSEVVPAHWQAALVHLGPVAQECAPELVYGWGDGFVGVTPQGWMRRWNPAGCVRGGPWEHADRVLSRADAVVLSAEDLDGDGKLLARYADQARLLVVTQGERGCTLYVRGQAHHVPAPKVHQVDPTGAGDVFAAAFFVSLYRCGDPTEAARFANCIAAGSVTRPGLAGTPTPEEVFRCGEARRNGSKT
ncbi:MAG TPA: ribokinase [Chloroflexi bacterium]|nr:ribokinase [Chloroflexota bacterium]